MMESSYKSPAAIPIAREPERMEHLVMCNKLLEEVRLLHCNEMWIGSTRIEMCETLCACYIDASALIVTLHDE